VADAPGPPARGPDYAHPFGQPVTQAVVDSLDGETVVLEGDEAKHLVKSLRLRPGETFVATDGAGSLARVALERTERGRVEGRVLERAQIAPPRLRVWLAADADGSRADWLVEKAAELGAWGFLPLAAAEPGRRARWSRLARAGLNVSRGGRAHRLDGERPALDAARGVRWAGAWGGEPRGADPLVQLLAAEGDWLVVSGPPSGFDPAARAAWAGLPGAVPVHLGSRRLRAETAALALLVVAALRSATAPETA
jgi:16S rRNA (uracil1498-N3)-methyltransferase